VATLVDASVLIAAERGQLEPERILETHAGVGLALAAVTASELLHGVHRLRTSARKARAEAFVEALLQAMPVVPFDLICARAHARLGADLARRGVAVGAHDLLIGATAVAGGFSVVTRDRRSFSKIPDLDVVFW
jgi:predicted nucleic acid-binding protein